MSRLRSMRSFERGVAVCPESATVGCATECRKSGVIVLESLMVLLILVIAIMAIVQWSVIMISQQGVTAAAAEGARVAARSVFDVDRATDTATAVKAILAAHGISDTNLVILIDDSAAETVQVTVTVPFDSTGVPNLLSTFGFDPFSPVRSFSVTSVCWED